MTCRLLEAIGNIAVCLTRDGDRRPLLEQATAIADRSRRAEMATRDQALIEERFTAARAALSRAAVEQGGHDGCGET